MDLTYIRSNFAARADSASKIKNTKNQKNNNQSFHNGFHCFSILQRILKNVLNSKNFLICIYIHVYVYSLHTHTHTRARDFAERSKILARYTFKNNFVEPSK